MQLKILTMEVRFEHDVVLARQRARTVAAFLKFDNQDQTRIATAVSEIVRNCFEYAGGGSVDFEFDNGSPKRYLISIRDRGRGIPNIDEILGGKYVSKTGMGLGMIGAKRLMDHFQVRTETGKGTAVTLGKNVPSKFNQLSNVDLNNLLASIERKPSENPYEELEQQNKELMRTLEELRARQIELAQLNKELDETNRGVVALYAELNDKADFLQRASELKSHFLSNMSHEFRTPLNSVLALSQILLDRMDGELTGEQEKQVQFIRRSAQDLTDLVNDLLDLAKVEAGKVTIRPTAFGTESLFSALRGMLRPLLSQNSSVSLIFEDPVDIPELYTDEAKVSQILRNFISNALKFTERGEVRVSARSGHDNTVIFAVADSPDKGPIGHRFSIRSRGHGRIACSRSQNDRIRLAQRRNLMGRSTRRAAAHLARPRESRYTPSSTMRWFDQFLAFLDDANSACAPAQIRAFEVILVALSVTELWSHGLEAQKLGDAFSWPLPIVVTLCGVVACIPAWRRLGFGLLFMALVVAIWKAFPSTGNHVYLQCFLCAMCTLLDPSEKEEGRLLIGSVRWVSCVIMFFAGIQKLVHGYYTNGLMPAFLLQEPRFGRIFGLLLPASEAQRLLSYSGLDGSGPYLVTTPLWLLASNAVWIFEIVLAVALFVAATRRAAVVAGIIFVVLIETGAREILFGLLYVSLLLMFLNSDVNRRFVPFAVVTCVVLLLMQLGWLPAVEIH